jgi:hypothetical protein
MTKPLLQRLLSKALGCYLCWSISGLVFGVIGANLQPGAVKSVLLALAAVLFVAGSLAVALDQDRTRRRREEEERESESNPNGSV